MAGQAEVGAARIRLGIDLAQFDSAVARIGSQLDAVSGKLDAWGSRAERIGARMSIALSAPLAAFGAFATRSAASFEKGMSNVSTIVDTTAESMGGMSKAVLDMSKALPVPIADLTAALYDVRSAGISASDAMNVLNQSARLGVAGLGTTKEAANIATSAINAFGISGKDVDTLMNNLFQTVRAGKTTVTELSQGFGGVAGTVSSAGVRIDEYLASVAALTTVGLPATQAHTELRAAIAGLTRETDVSKKVLDSLGATTFKNLIEKAGGLVPAFNQIVSTLNGNEAALIKLVGSVEAYNAILSLTGKQNGAYLNTLTSMRSGVDELGIAFDKQAVTAATKWQLLLNAFERIKISVGNILLPILTQLADWLEKLAQKFEALSPETQTWMVYLGAAAAMIGPLVVGLGMFASALATVIPAIWGAAAALAGLAIAGGPITVVVAAVAALAAAFVIFRDDLKSLWDGIVDFISEDIKTLGSQLVTFAAQVATFMGTGVVPMVGQPSGSADPATAKASDTESWKANTEAVNENKAAVVSNWQTTLEAIQITDMATAAKTKATEAERAFNQLVREGVALAKADRSPQEILADKAKALDAALAKNKISAAQFGTAMQRATLISLNSYAAMASGIANNLASAFGNSKAFAIAAAIINTAESVTKTLATYGVTPWGIAAAAAAAAAGAAQISTIMSTNKGSSGGTGGGASALAPAAQAAAGAGGQENTLLVQGISANQMFSGDVVRSLAQKLIEFQADGGKVVLA